MCEGREDREENHLAWNSLERKDKGCKRREEKRREEWWCKWKCHSLLLPVSDKWICLFIPQEIRPGFACYMYLSRDDARLASLLRDYTSLYIRCTHSASPNPAFHTLFDFLHDGRLKRGSYVQSVPLFLSWNIFRQNPFFMTCNYPVDSSEHLSFS